MRNYLIFDSGDSRDYGVYISGQGTFEAPVREYNMQPIPGRNGDLIGSETRLENMEVTYPAFIYRNFRENLRALRSFLLSHVGYFRLEDTYHPDEYRMAVYKGGLSPEVLNRNQAGQFDLVFETKPQRWLKEGERTRTLTRSGVLSNPSHFAAAPLLRVYGTGVLGIGSDSITITAANQYTDIDCDIMEAYKGTESRNAYITLSGNDFPKLEPGNNNISLGTGISRVDITPRWWEV